MNKLAALLDRRWPARVVSINWGPWDSPGMVSSELAERLTGRGVPLLTPEEGLRRLCDEIRFGESGEAEALIGPAQWPRKESPNPIAAM